MGTTLDLPDDRPPLALPLLEVRDDCPLLKLQPEEFESIDSEDEADKGLEVHRQC